MSLPLGEAAPQGAGEGTTRQVYQVAELAEILRSLLEQSLPSVWVQGEISNYRNPSGHWYFTLKDASAQIPCVMFKGRNYLVRPVPKDGDSVLLRGQVTFYPAQGKAQIVVEHLEPAGEGALLRAFEELKKKLAAEGLFDEKLKRPVPAAPRGIGIITSPTGAALQDILTTLRRRYPLGSVFVYPVPVQGEAAPAAIVKALAELPKLAAVDVIILARGGGSIEDLWAFNDERIARAIRACESPVIVGVGHEIDFTIADFAADLRAPTPTGAAERVSPDVADWKARLNQLQTFLTGSQQEYLLDAGESLNRLHARLDVTHPGRRLQQFTQRLDELGERLRIANPARLAETLRQRLNAGAEQLRSRLTERLRELQHRLRSHTALLHSLGPQAVLERGYAIVQNAGGTVLRSSAQVTAQESIGVTLAQGRLSATVTKSEPSGI